MVDVVEEVLVETTVVDVEVEELVTEVEEVLVETTVVAVEAAHLSLLLHLPCHLFALLLGVVLAL